MPAAKRLDMKNKARRPVCVSLIVLLGILSLGAVSSGLWKVSRSRTFQFFGGLVPRVETTEKLVALTFDDGPTPGHTEEIIRVLNDNNIKATFFLIGEDLRRYPEQGRKLAAAGHELGNHTYSHRRMVLKTPSFVRREVEETDKLIRATGYQGEILFRAPFTKKLLTLPYYLSRHGRKTITCDVEPESYPEVAENHAKIASYILSHAQPGSIILLHVMYGNEESVQAVSEFVPELKRRGYRFVTVSELLAAEDRT